MEQVAANGYGRLDPQTRLLRLAGERKVPDLLADIDLTLSGDHHVLRIQNQTLGDERALHRFELSDAAPDARFFFVLCQHQPEAVGDIEPGQLRERLFDFPVWNHSG